MVNDVKDLLQMINTTSKHIEARLTLDSGCCKCLLEYIEYLKERVAYLERSNNRREETIMHLRDENIDLSDKIDELRNWLQDEIIDSKAGSSQYYWFGRVLSKLNELEGGKNE